MNAEARDVRPAIVNADAESLTTLLASEDRPVLVDFWAEWCGPCRALAPILESLADDYAGRAVVAKIDVDANPELARRFGIRSIPTVIAFSGGEAAETLVGVRSKADYAGAIDQLAG